MRKTVINGYHDSCHATLISVLLAASPVLFFVVLYLSVTILDLVFGDFNIENH